jgi:hypothetical protein
MNCEKASADPACSEPLGTVVKQAKTDRNHLRKLKKMTLIGIRIPRRVLSGNSRAMNHVAPICGRCHMQIGALEADLVETLVRINLRPSADIPRIPNIL